MDEVMALYLRELEPLINCFNRRILLNETRELLPILVEAKQTVERTPSRNNISERISGSLPHTEASGRADGPADLIYWADVRNYGLVSVVVAVLYTMCDALSIADEKLERIFPNTRESEREALLEKLHGTALFFLQQSHFQQQPTLWTLQSIFLLQRKYLYELQAPVCAMWNSTAVRIAQTMGLNRLGSAHDDMLHWRAPQRESDSTSTDDNAPLRPSGATARHADVHRMALTEFAERNFALRELGRKVWHALVSFDWYLAAHTDYCYSVPDALSRSAPPAELDDEDVIELSARQVDELGALAEGRLKRGASDATFVGINTTIARSVREMAQMRLELMLTAKTPSFSYEDVQKLDQHFRSILGALPDVFQFNGVTENSNHVRAMVAKKAFLALQRLHVQEQIHFRLMLLHRPFVAAGLADVAYKSSVDTCIEAARITMAVWKELQRTGNPNQRLWSLRSHVVHAVFILHTVLDSSYLAPDSTTRSELLDDLRGAMSSMVAPADTAACGRFPLVAQTLESIRQFCDEADGKPSADAATDPSAHDLLSEWGMFEWSAGNAAGASAWLHELFDL